jgi:hypothetical protein
MIYYNHNINKEVDEMSKYKVDNEELKNELQKYIDSCEFKDIKDKNGN